MRYRPDHTLTSAQYAAVWNAYDALAVDAWYFASNGMPSIARSKARRCRELIAAFGVRNI